MWKSFTSFLSLAALLGGCAVVEPPRMSDEQTRERVVAEASVSGVEQSAPVPQLSESTVSDYARALSYLDSNENEKAEKLFERMTRSHPELAGPWVNLGRLRLNRGETEAAREAFMQALEANPQSCHAHVQLGVMLRYEGQFEAARGHYQACLAADPEFSIAHLNLGILSELYMGDLDTALAAYERFLELNPEAEPRVKGWIADLKRRVGT